MKKSLQIKLGLIAVLILILICIKIYDSQKTNSVQTESPTTPAKVEESNLGDSIIAENLDLDVDAPVEAKEVFIEDTTLVPVEQDMTVEEKGKRREFLLGIKTIYKTSEIVDNCATVNLENCVGKAVNTAVENTGDITLCQDMPSDISAIDCEIKYAYKFAEEKDDVNQCTKLGGEKERDSCMFAYYSNKAVTTGDISLCENLGDNKSFCEEDFNAQGEEF